MAVRASKEPWSPYERAQMIRIHYAGLVDVIIIPDISSINIGRAVGYMLRCHDVPNDVAAMSGSRIRQSLADSDDSWRALVPPAVASIMAQQAQEDDACTY